MGARFDLALLLVLLLNARRSVNSRLEKPAACVRLLVVFENGFFSELGIVLLAG